MIFKKFNFYFYIIIFFIKINIASTLEIKTLAVVDNAIITNEDLRKESIVLAYLFDNQIDPNRLNAIALQNLVEEKIKALEIKKFNMLISDEESIKFLEIILKNKKKTLKDFREKVINKKYEDHLINKIKIEISWNKFISAKFKNFININIDELKSNKEIEIDSKEYNNMIYIEKNKKLESLSETYFNEIKNNILIIYK